VRREAEEERLPNGGICTTAVMTASHRGQQNSLAGLPSDRSDMPHAYLATSYPGRLGSASAMGTKVRPPCSSAMTTASAPNDLPDLIASAHSSLADLKACERASSMVASSVAGRGARSRRKCRPSAFWARDRVRIRFGRIGLPPLCSGYVNLAGSRAAPLSSSTVGARDAPSAIPISRTSLSGSKLMSSSRRPKSKSA
jgi:hypothetical protein